MLSQFCSFHPQSIICIHIRHTGCAGCLSIDVYFLPFTAHIITAVPALEFTNGRSRRVWFIQSVKYTCNLHIHMCAKSSFKMICTNVSVRSKTIWSDEGISFKDPIVLMVYYWYIKWFFLPLNAPKYFPVCDAFLKLCRCLYCNFL